jgi:hypothetical protein
MQGWLWGWASLSPAGWTRIAGCSLLTLSLGQTVKKEELHIRVALTVKPLIYIYKQVKIITVVILDILTRSESSFIYGNHSESPSNTRNLNSSSYYTCDPRPIFFFNVKHECLGNDIICKETRKIPCLSY